MPSADETRVCEKCGSAAVVLTEEVGAVFTHNFIRHDGGVVAEHWTCQRCPHDFRVSLERPNPATMWLAIGAGVAALGLLGTLLGILTSLGVLAPTDTRPSNTGAFQMLFGLLVMFIPGTAGAAYGYFNLTLLTRNPLAHGVVPPPREHRAAHLPRDRRPRRCTCSGTMTCVQATQHSFNLVPTGTSYVHRCTHCPNIVHTESVWRLLALSAAAIVLLLFAYTVHALDMRDKTLYWIFLAGSSVLAFALITFRALALVARLRFVSVSR